MTESVSIIEFQDFNEKRFTKKDLFKLESCTVFMLNFLPGQKMPAHKHPGCELIFNILEGTGELQIGDENFVVSAKEVLHGSGDNMIAFTNTGDVPVSIYVVMNKVLK